MVLGLLITSESLRKMKLNKQTNSKHNRNKDEVLRLKKSYITH